jgi:hypothetical protein
VALEEGHLILDAAQLVVAHLPERVRSPGTAQLLRAEKTAAMLRVEYLPASIGHRFTSSNGSALGTHGQSQVARHFPSEALMTDPPSSGSSNGNPFGPNFANASGNGGECRTFAEHFATTRLTLSFYE